ncbi:MAG: nucleotide exchange factor GrpE [Calditrichaeota bacterium]|nr:nucleotide exchange factor GrpE [Calditrichota bacterium]
MDMNETNRKEQDELESQEIQDPQTLQGVEEDSGQKDELENARREAAEWRDKYVRQLAEFDNFRKRTRGEMELLRESVAEGLLLKLLDVYDDMNRTLESSSADDSGLRRGVELIHQKFTSYLESQKISKLDCRGKEFNPDEHDAILMQPRAGFPANVVLEEVLPGYKLGDRVIRHAQVIVSSDADGAEEGSTE